MKSKTAKAKGLPALPAFIPEVPAVLAVGGEPYCVQEATSRPFSCFALAGVGDAVLAIPAGTFLCSAGAPGPGRRAERHSAMSDVPDVVNS